MGVSLMDLADGDSVVGVARSADLTDDEGDETSGPSADGDQGALDAGNQDAGLGADTGAGDTGQG
jgi:hypothetical protein